MPAMSPSNPTISNTNPDISVMVNPMPKRLSCGAARVTTPNARFTMISATSAGSATSSPVSNIRAPHSPIDHNRFWSMMAPPMGRLLKLFASAPISTRWPLTAR